MKPYHILHSSDHVAVALISLQAGESFSINGHLVTLQDSIPAGHKFSLADLPAHSDIIKYGSPIGHTLCAIKAGEHVHTHNLATNLSGVSEYSYHPVSPPLFSSPFSPPDIFVYERHNGAIGIRNELWILPTVGCVNGIGQQAIERFYRDIPADDIDGVFVFGHNYGCSQLGEDYKNTRTILQCMASHPNAGGVLVLGLGCENNQIGDFSNTLSGHDPKRIRFMACQDVDDELEHAVSLLKELYEVMRYDKRRRHDFSALKVGLKCGGSDGFSGITANPLLGVFSDYLIGHGGSTILTEVPEMFGAETLLMNRCITEEVYEKLVCLINDFKAYFIAHNQEIYENPSPGNKKGGITTLEEKSLGCTQKSGHSFVVNVLSYGKRLETQGLNLLNAPGNDLVATTALGASGCHLVLFTTGRGTPFGGFVPTMKISTNTPLWAKKGHWIDFNAGELVNDESMENLLKLFINEIAAVASGKRITSERNNCREMAIFKSGVTL